MDTDKIRKIRLDTINTMQDQLAHIEQTNLPRWLLLLFMIPLLMYEIVSITAKFILGGMCAMAVLPFKFAVVWIDTICTIYWYMSKIVERMERK